MGVRMSIDDSLQPDFDKRGGLIIAIAVDGTNPIPLMQAYMNREAWDETMRTGRMTYWSTSRNELWLKGATSGNHQIVKEVYLDCDMDCAVFVVEQQGKGACHEGKYSCFYRRMK